MECLPSDVVLDILFRLPVASVVDCKLVCKRFLDLISHPRYQFAKIHHQRQLLQLASYGDGDASSSSLTGLFFSFQEKLDYKVGSYKPLRFCYGDEYNNEMNIYGNFSRNTLQNTSISVSTHDLIIGSCNGLICVNRYHQENMTISISNPITWEYVDLPGDTLWRKLDIPVFGFGYVHSMTNEQYKVVRISYRKMDYLEKGVVQVYTIGSGSGWRTIGVTSYNLYAEGFVGTFANGELYWIDGQEIVAFILADEEFRSIQSPSCLDDDADYMLQALRGNLCICHHREKDNLLDSREKRNGGALGGGLRDTCPEAKPILITKKNEVLFVHRNSALYCYDPKANTVIQLWNADVVNREIRYLSAFPHMNSFVSLEDLGERSERKLREKSLEDTD